MFGLRRLFGKKLLGYAGLGCAGAMASNCVQLLLARYLIFGPALRYLTAPFLASGLVTGIGLGLVCEYFCRHSVWYLSRNSSRIEPVVRGAEDVKGRGKREEERSFGYAEGLFVTGLLMALIFLFNRSLEVRAAQFLFFCLLALFFRKKINLLATALFMISIVFFHLLAPFGKVLVSFGPLRITQGSLYAGIDKALVISGLVIISRICVKSDLKLPGTIGSLLGESLRLLELMRERMYLIKRKQIISGLDQLMLEIEKTAFDTHDNTHLNTHTDTHTNTNDKEKVKNILLLCAMVIITAGMNFIPHS